MNIEFIELEFEWSSELSVFDLRNYILSNLNKYGEPIRWAITSVTSHSEEKIQIMSLEVVLIINQDKRNINSELN